MENQNQESVPEQDLDLDDSIDVFVRNLWRRIRGVRVKFSGQQASLKPKLIEGEASYGAEDYRRALVAFISSDGEWLTENSWPVAAFAKNPTKWMDGASPIPAPPRNSAAVDSAAGATPRTETPAASTAPRQGEPHHGPEIASFQDRWNELVPACPVVWNDKRDSMQNLATCAGDPEFNEHFDELCKKAQQIHVARAAADEPVEWLTFRWILKQNNWWRVVSGEFNWMLRASGSRLSREEREKREADREFEEYMKREREFEERRKERQAAGGGDDKRGKSDKEVQDELQAWLDAKHRREEPELYERAQEAWQYILAERAEFRAQREAKGR